ncbi:MAG: hypothetical protein ACFFCX_03870 [Candidatus Sifarchaeia archaeon]
MEIDNIRTKSEKQLRYRRGRARNYPRFKKILEKYKEKGDPLNLEDVEKFMGLTHHTLRNYAKELNLRMIIMTDEDGIRWVAFKEDK